MASSLDIAVPQRALNKENKRELFSRQTKARGKKYVGLRD